ncbi:FxsA protein affecting phage T7 exclusion by the F plasmid [Mannheimia varigena USDA-ARS-USMARC-1388]|uniref:FxsA family protein n=1 Tax=Mannheimia varigena TaxID=85404 RepID=UPI0003E3599B|nr:FxsA family protein [Mannheimia varigena]AHG80287.1 FxsA protein affecting phage T7 exclusion by the F plasmid [Mannheimia varigena USDA-ARS-USMARC-1388]
MPILMVLFGIFFYIYCEISLLVSIGSEIGVLATILLLVAISFLGLWFVKLRGVYTLYSIKQDLSQGKMPTEAVSNSIMFVLAGILLIIPGFLSDILAILCVLPFSRKLIQAFVINSVKNKVFMRFTSQNTHFHSQSAQESNTFDAEFERKFDPQDETKRIK